MKVVKTKNKELNKIRIGFDYDGTLSDENVQAFAMHLAQLGCTIYLVTARTDNFKTILFARNKKLFQVCDLIGIERNNIIFTKGLPKVFFLEDLNICAFVDNSLPVIQDCKKSKIVNPVHYTGGSQFITDVCFIIGQIYKVGIKF